jgi:hypothetical protein
MLGRSLEAMKNLPTGLLTLHVLAKFLFGMGLGMLLVHHYDVPAAGTGRILVVVAVLIAIPSTVRIISSIGKS